MNGATMSRKRQGIIGVCLASIGSFFTLSSLAFQAADTPQLKIETVAGDAVGERTNQTSLKLSATVAGWSVGDVFAGKDGTLAVLARNGTHDFNLFANQGEQRIAVTLKNDTNATQLVTVNKPLIFDTIGPAVTQVKLVGAKGGDATLQIYFDADDLNETQAKCSDNFKITRMADGNSFTSDIGFKAGTPALGPNRNVVLIRLTDMVTDTYRVEITSGLTDQAGNSAGYRDGKPAKEQRFYFNSYPDRDKGQHVEFPNFVPRQRLGPGGFNPGDHVETRVVRLYYYRDAHRVAEIINRNVQSYNRAAVDQKRREAESSRNRAETLTDDRRSNEREAVQAAQEARQAEHELQRAEELAGQARAKAAQDSTNLKASELRVEAATREKQDADRLLAAAQTANDPAKLKFAEAAVAFAEEQLRHANSTKQSLAAAALSSENDRRAKETAVKEATARLQAKRNTEIAKREEWNQSEAKEDRASEDQFRKEVAASHEDPDTYAPGKPESVDAVTQVSISVIGEGLIQLRGPIRGINKIRTMIDQIDSPVGQVKVGIFTVQINGEHGDRMEKVAQRVEGNIDISRFLTAQSMMLLRRAVQELAAEVAQEAERGLHQQVDRDRKYLYTFFGRDFIDELYAMDSEFLHTENKVLCLHSMDTVSRSNALFVMALAKSNIRQRIIERFMQLIECELPKAEYDFRKASRVLPCGRKTQREVYEKAATLYRFGSLRGMFDVPLSDDQQNIMSPMQREFIRLAQIFKSQMISESELKRQVVKRGLIEDRSYDDEELARVLDGPHQKALALLRTKFEKLVESQTTFDEVMVALATAIGRVQTALAGTAKSADTLTVALAEQRMKFVAAKALASTSLPQTNLRATGPSPGIVFAVKQLEELNSDAQKAQQFISKSKARLDENQALSTEVKDDLKSLLDEMNDKFDPRTLSSRIDSPANDRQKVSEYKRKATARLDSTEAAWSEVRRRFTDFRKAADLFESDTGQFEKSYTDLLTAIGKLGDAPDAVVVRAKANDAYQVVLGVRLIDSDIKRATYLANRTRRDLDAKKLMDFLIDEKEEKWIELREGTKAHIATMDNYLKRLAIALEDDFKVQFYDPAFAEIRKAAREWDVNLSQVERTTILTNNRAFAKVSPQATMEFDLPKRDILIQEAFKGAKAMVEDYGALLQDPTFLAASKMLSGSPTASAASPPKANIAGLPSQGQPGPPVKSVLPGLPSATEEQVLNQSAGQDREIGAALEALIPDPAIYKFETGTGFEIRPVIQPDGDSVIYDFNYMYTTNVREPVRADEKHLGRVKRHFIDTQVQTSSFELREISRYQVALKASRTSRGVPLFEDIPGVGALFRPLPSAESSLQQNIILGQSVVYPTLFDLMGLRWAPHLVNVSHRQLLDDQHLTQGRMKILSDWVAEKTEDKLDEFLGIRSEYKHLHRPDLYHSRDVPSPYHPGGYAEPNIADPTRRQFEIPDRRPNEMREPAYEPRRRVPAPEDEIDVGPRGTLILTEPAPRTFESGKKPGAAPRNDMGTKSPLPATRDSGVRTANYDTSARSSGATNKKEPPKGTPKNDEKTDGPITGRVKKIFGR